MKNGNEVPGLKGVIGPKVCPLCHAQATLAEGEGQQHVECPTCVRYVTLQLDFFEKAQRELTTTQRRELSQMARVAARMGEVLALDVSTAIALVDAARKKRGDV